MSVLSMVLLVSFILADVLQLSHCVCIDIITVQPVSINTTLNSTVVFSCEAIADHLSFTVNGEAGDDEVVMGRGFSATSVNYGNGTRRAELQAIAHEYNNNTNISCRADIYKPPPAMTELSNRVVLMIQGLLYGVSNLDYTFINRSSVLLTWTAPYTLDNVPITGYYIVNGLVNITTTNTNIALSATNPDPCILHNISVSPINNAGIGLSNDVSFYHETVPLITLPVSVVPVIDGQQISLNISINVVKICKGEYPDSVAVNILHTNNVVINNTSIIPEVNDQLMITGVITVPNSLNTFIVNVSLSNNGGEFLSTPSFGFGFLGPVSNIKSAVKNCSTIDITWTAPTVDDRVPILYYILRTYDAVTGGLVDTVSVYNTSYQFVANNLLIHHYTYVIIGVNELGEGISNNETFSYQRVPRPVSGTDSNIKKFNQMTATVSYNIPVKLECTGEAPENTTIIIWCNGAGVVYYSIEQVKYLYLVENTPTPMNITGSVSVPQNQQCNMSIAFSNEAGSSEPFILVINLDISPPVSVTPSPTIDTNSELTGFIIGAIGAILVLVICIFIIVAVAILTNYSIY